VAILFERGLFDAYSTRITSDAVAFYAVGLFAFGGSKILSSCFFAMNDTRTPFKVAAFTITINIILNIILMFPMKLSGIALATSISNGVNFFVLLFLITKRITFNMTPFIVYFLKVLFATFGMAAMIAWLSARWLGDIPGKDLGESCAGLFGTISLGALIYFLLAHLVCHKEAGAIMSRVIKGRE